MLGRVRFGLLVQQHWKGIGNYGTVGLELGLSVLLPLLLGDWADGRFGTRPWLAVVGAALGLAAGVRSLLRVLARANREAEAAERADREARSRFHEPP
ncbi:MAG: AtpZ/AtpI family protein [Polyangiaceae bacterium]|nr:AtpZ/AtpI family protein [Polyangiaceae bacterium]